MTPTPDHRHRPREDPKKLKASPESWHSTHTQRVGKPRSGRGQRLLAQNTIRTETEVSEQRVVRWELQRVLQGDNAARWTSSVSRNPDLAGGDTVSLWAQHGSDTRAPTRPSVFSCC